MAAEIDLKFITSTIFIITVCFLIFIYYFSRKYSPRRNRSLLFELLCLSDALYLIFSFPLVFAVNRGTLLPLFRLFFGTAVNLFTIISMELFVFLSLDVYLSIKYSLRYPLLLSAEKLKKYLGYTFGATTLILILTHIEKPTRYFSRDVRVYFYIFLFAVRAVTSVTILLFAWFNKMVRDNQRRALMREKQLFGEKAEKLSMLRSVKRHMKDIAVLNIGNAFFIIPLAIFTLVHLIHFDEQLSRLDMGVRLLHSVASPLMTIFSNSETKRSLIRYAKRTFRFQNRIRPN